MWVFRGIMMGVSGALVFHRHIVFFFFFFKLLITFIGSLEKCHTSAFNALIFITHVYKNLLKRYNLKKPAD